MQQKLKEIFNKQNIRTFIYDKDISKVLTPLIFAIIITQFIDVYSGTFNLINKAGMPAFIIVLEVFIFIIWALIMNYYQRKREKKSKEKIIFDCCGIY